MADEEKQLTEEELEKIAARERLKEQYQSQNIEGLDRECQYCMKPITIDDVVDRNPPMRISNMPGFYHARCKAYFDGDIISTGKMKGAIDPWK